jgi:hypothetical protein
MFMNLLKRTFILMVAGFLSLASVAQEPLRDFFQGGVDDARTLSKAYLKPYGEMLGTSLNAGWYNTAKVHKLGGFDITFSVMNSVAPSSAQSFDLNALDLNNFAVQGAGQNDVVLTPTVAGEMGESQRPFLTPLIDGEYPTNDGFRMPNGSGNDKLPLPMLQAAVGLPFNTEVMARVVPKMKFGDAGEVSVLGFGVKHSLKDYIPFVKRVPFLQLSLLAGYTSFDSSTDIPGTPQVEVTDGALDISSGAFTSRLLVGANFPLIAIYTGVGYGSANSDFSVNGRYTVESIQETFTDPFTLGYKTSGIDFNAGLRLRLGFLALHADYTVADYSVLTAGVGINIR